MALVEFSLSPHNELRLVINVFGIAVYAKPAFRDFTALLLCSPLRISFSHATRVALNGNFSMPNSSGIRMCHRSAAANE